MKKPSEFNYNNVPGVKGALKILIKSVIRTAYLKPRAKIVKLIKRNDYENVKIGFTTRFHRLAVDRPVYNPDGIKGLFIVASYTNSDKNYIPGMTKSCEAFEKIILYHDKNQKHDFNYNESLRFQLLIAAAKRRGAKWIFIGSPKTRFSKQFRNQISPYIDKYTDTETVLILNERYLWGDFDHYVRVGNAKKKATDTEILKLFSVTNNMKFDNAPIHAKQRPINYKNVIKTTASRYYLGRFNMDTMKKKADFYNAKDGRSYDGLMDVSKPIKHKEDILGIGKFENEELIGD